MKFILAAAALTLCVVVQAQSYPSKTMTLVVPSAPGGPSDVLARGLSEKLRPALRQDIVVENRGGANGTIGVASVLRAPPDGHTVLLSVDGPVTTIPALMPHLSYDSIRDLTPVAIVADRGDVVLAVPADSPAKSAKELAELLRKDPKTANYVSSGAGFPSHIVSELYKREADFQAQHIAVRGAGAALNELLSGRFNFSFPPASLAVAYAKAGRIRVLAVAAEKRNTLFPDTPTFAEAGYPKISPPSYWIGLYVAAGTPLNAIDRLAAATREATHSEDFIPILKLQGMVASDATPTQLKARVAKETEYWKQLIRQLDIKLE